MTSENRSEELGKGSPPPRWLLKTVARVHVLLHRLSGGRAFNTLSGDEVCFVTMKGAKSGRTLTIPLMYVPYRDGLLLVASLGGAPRNPAGASRSGWAGGPPAGRTPGRVRPSPGR